MFQRLFRNKSFLKDNDDNYSHLLLEPQSWSPTNLRDEHVRILFCQDTGEPNKTILYDSDHSLMNTSTTSRSPPLPPMAKSWNNSQIRNTGRNSGDSNNRHDWRVPHMRTVPSFSSSDIYQAKKNHQRQSGRKLDLTGDMIFGTAPLAYKGMNTKIHYYKRDENPQIIISKIFTLSNTITNQYFPVIDRRTSFSSVNSDKSISTSTFFMGEDMDSASLGDDSCFYQQQTQQQYNLTKRSRRFNQTCIENDFFAPAPLPPNKLPENGTSVTKPTRHASRSVKYAVSIIITLENKNETLNDFIFSHFYLVENHLHQFQAVVFKQLCQYFSTNETATSSSSSSVSNYYPQQQPFVATGLRKRSNPSSLSLGSNTFQNDTVIIDAATTLKTSFFDLFTTPRIQTPLWLNMSTFPHKKIEYEKSLVKELVHLIRLYNNKAHNYFISTLLTVVLMHHLSWVHTVAPPTEAMQNIGNWHHHHGNYDPLWAQLSDLYGYINMPCHITRTLVVGLRPSIVKRILYVLSYFIRCNEVYENIETRKTAKRGLSKSCSSESIFSRELGHEDVPSDLKFEDKIMRHFTGEAGIESIAIPPAGTTDASAAMVAGSYNTSSSSMDSCSVKSNPMNPRWFLKSSGGSTDTTPTLEENRAWSPELIFSSSPSSLVDVAIPFSEDGTHHVPMPKSTITRMEPDITQHNDSSAVTATMCSTFSNTTTNADRLFAKSYGRSLMASYCDGFKNDFVLMGLPTVPPMPTLVADLKRTLEGFTLSDGIREARCLVIDTNSFKCKVLSYKDLNGLDSNSTTTSCSPTNLTTDASFTSDFSSSNITYSNNNNKKTNSNSNDDNSDSSWQAVAMSSLVHDMLTTVKQKFDEANNSGSCEKEEEQVIVNYIEDQLQLIYLYSTMLQDKVLELQQAGHEAPLLMDTLELANSLKLDQSDIPLLLAVCSTFDAGIWEQMQKSDNY